MDKEALVAEVKSAFKKLEEDGIHLECVYMIPVTTLFRNESYIAVVGTPVFSHLGTRDKIAAIRNELDKHMSAEVRRHIQMVWVFDDAEQARRRIDIEDVDEFITPIVEPAHA
jgi:hypothetical protein